MSVFYRSDRVGKGGKVFSMLKFRTLRENNKNSYSHTDNYTKYGRFMRKYRLDEIPQLWHVLTGRMALFGYRPMEASTLDLYPPHIKEKLLSVKPGLIAPAGIYFMDEEHILALSKDPEKDYWTKILPQKLTLDLFYIENKCLLFDIALVYMAIKKRLWTR